MLHSEMVTPQGTHDKHKLIITQELARAHNTNKLCEARTTNFLYRLQSKFH